MLRAIPRHMLTQIRTQRGSGDLIHVKAIAPRRNPNGRSKPGLASGARAMQSQQISCRRNPRRPDPVSGK